MKICVMLVMVLAFCSACKKDSEKYIAVVNGTKLDRAQFDQMVNRRVTQIEKFGRKITGTQKYNLEKNILDEMVNRKLLSMEAEKKNIKIKDEEVESRIKSIKDRYPNKDDFDKILKQQNLSEDDLKNLFKEQLTIEELIKQEISDKIGIPDADLKKQYTSNQDMYKVPNQVQASHILIKTSAKKGSPEAKKEDNAAKAKLDKIRSDILAKKTDFAKAAGEFSDCPSKSKGGDLGLFPRGRMVKEFEKIAFSLGLNKISKPFKSPFGWHILKVTKKEKARTKKFEEVKEEMRERMVKQESNKNFRDYLEKLKSTAKIVSYLKEPPLEPESEVANPSPVPAPKDDSKKAEKTPVKKPGKKK